MSRPNYKFNYFSETEYLEFEEYSLTKHEYFNGEVFAMAGASLNHQILISRAVQKFSNHLENTPCIVLSSDIKVRADEGNKYFYPDVVVTCEKENNAYFIESPRLIVEVLSKSTREFDQDLKRQIYQTIPTLEEYVLIEQERVEIQVFRRADNWQSSYYYIDDEITFSAIDLTLPVLELYQRVENDDMRDFLQTDEKI